MAMSRHFFARSTLMAAVGDAESRIWMVTKSADKALAVFRVTSPKAWNVFMSFPRRQLYTSKTDVTPMRQPHRNIPTLWKVRYQLVCTPFDRTGSWLR
jgi:hypothetical protein